MSAEGDKADKAPRRRKAAAAGDKPAADKPPVAPAPNRGGRPPAAVAKRRELERQLTEAFGMIGMGLVAMGTSEAVKADGFAVIERAEPLAQALGALAEQNPAVMRVLTASVNGGAWFGVIAAFSGLAVAIAQNHGAMPAPQLDPATAAAVAAANGAPTPPADAPAA